MWITSPPSFLILQRLRDTKRKIGIATSQAEVLRDWQPSTRLSPIFTVQEYSSHEPGLDKTGHLIFLGPVHPELVGERLGSHCRLWLTLGLFNILVATNFKKEREALIEWATKRKIHFEAWTLSHRIIKDVETSGSTTVEPINWRRDLAELSKRNVPEEL
jgi:hypothetical protein